MIVDTHVHLDDERYRDDLDQVLSRAEEAGVQRFIIPGADPDTLDYALSLAQKYEHIYFAVGIHPYDMKKFDQLDFEAYLSHPKCVAVGECGLDYYRLEGTDDEKAREKAEQETLFRTQIRLAKACNKPLIVHIRDASSDAKKILLEEESGTVGGVLHCYNADEQLLSLAEHSFYFGIGGVLTFKNAKKLINVLPKIPKEKLVIETDGPYLTPHPFRGKRNEPLYTTLVSEKMAELLDSDFKTISALTTENAKNLFNIL